MTINLDFIPTGFEVVDVHTSCDGVIPAKLPYLPNRTILDNPEYGFWSAENMEGNKFTIILSGTPSTGEILLDFIEGTVKTSELIDIYMRARCFAPIQSKFKQLVLSFPEHYEETTDVNIGQFFAKEDMYVYQALIHRVGQNPSQSITLRTTSYQTMDLTVTNTNYSDKTSLTNLFYIPKDSYFRLSFPNGGYGIADFIFELNYL